MLLEKKGALSVSFCMTKNWPNLKHLHGWTVKVKGTLLFLGIIRQQKEDEFIFFIVWTWVKSGEQYSTFSLGVVGADDGGDCEALAFAFCSGLAKVA